MRQPDRKTIDVSNIQLSYLEWNQGDIPLLLLHGLADNAVVWTQLGNDLADSYHIVAPDLRGHGNSSKPMNGYKFTDLIEDLNSLMNHLGWDSATILGHSWSGKLACVWATMQPQRFHKLMLVDPFFIDQFPAWFKLTFPILYKTLPFLKMMGPFPSYEDAQQQAQQLKQYRGWSDLQQAVFQAGIEEKLDGKWGSKFTVAARNQIFDDVLKVAGLTQPIELPTVFFKPDAGLNRTDWQLRPYRTYLPQLQLVEVPGNHWAFLVEPEAFNRAIAQAL